MSCGITVLSLHHRYDCRHGPLQLQTLPALTYLNFTRQKLEEMPEALTTMTSLRVTAEPVITLM